MSLFRPGSVPAGLIVERALFPNLEEDPYSLPEPQEEGFEAPPQAAKGPGPDPAAATQAQAQAVLNQARLEAAEILQRAAAEAETAVAAAREAGFEAGRQEGAAAARTEVELLRQQVQFELEKARVQADGQRLAAEAEARAIRAEAEAERQSLLSQAREEARTLVEEARQEQWRYLSEAQSALVELAVAAAMRLVQGHLAVQPAAVVAMVAAGLRRLKESNCTVRVHPQDLPLLHAQRSVLERELGAGSLRLQPDPTLQAGGYTISSPQGFIDGSLESQGAHLRTALTAALGGD